LDLLAAAERLSQPAGDPRKHCRRKRREALLHGGERLLVRILGNLGYRLLPPTVARPTLGHDRPPPPLSPGTGEIFYLGELIHEGRHAKPDRIAIRAERNALRPTGAARSAPSPAASQAP